MNLIKEMNIIIFIISTVITTVLSYPYTNFATPVYDNPVNNNLGHQKIFSEYEAPQSFATTSSPLLNPHKTQEYRDFLKELYRFDKDKSPQTFMQQQQQQQLQQQHQTPHHNQYQHAAPTYQTQYHQYQPQPQPHPIQYVSPNHVYNPVPNPGDSISSHKISKRAIVFRPLFVYRQQTIKKERLNATKKPQQQPKRQQEQQYYNNYNYPVYSQNYAGNYIN